MSEYIRFVGFDENADGIAVAMAQPSQAPVEDASGLSANAAAVRKWVMRQAGRATLLVCYETGPTGFRLQRQLATRGVACQVIASGLVPTRPTARVKRDRGDARHWAYAWRAGTLTRVRVPTEAEGALPKLVRARTMAVQARQQARKRAKSAMLRWGIRPRPSDTRHTTDESTFSGAEPQYDERLVLWASIPGLCGLI